MSSDFSMFDKRHYPTVHVREGYGEWVSTYERTVHDEMDLRVLARLMSVRWNAIGRAIDLGCGTGRTGVWLKRHDVARIDGIDLTPEMLKLAKTTDAYETVAVGDVLATGLDCSTYDLAIASLIDEHIRDLWGLYREASRLLRPAGYFVIVGYHPQFIMTSGMPTHFHRESGDPVAIETYVHLFSDHTKAASEAGLALIEMEEGVIDEVWIKKKPTWRRFLGLPISFAFVWRADLR